MKGGYADDGPMQSLLWIRSWTLDKYNLFEDKPYYTSFRSYDRRTQLSCLC